MSLNLDLLRSSFRGLQAEQTEFSALFYRNLFADYPEVQPLFAHANMQEQPKKLFASLVLVVENLAKPDALTHPLHSMGTRHVKYGVYPKHYPMVGGTLLKSMAATLKENWTPETEAAWSEAYSAITAIMLEGCDYPSETLDPKSAA